MLAARLGAEGCWRLVGSRTWCATAKAHPHTPYPHTRSFPHTHHTTHTRRIHTHVHVHAINNAGSKTSTFVVQLHNVRCVARRLAWRSGEADDGRCGGQRSHLRHHTHSRSIHAPLPCLTEWASQGPVFTCFPSEEVASYAPTPGTPDGRFGGALPGNDQAGSDVLVANTCGPSDDDMAPHHNYCCCYAWIHRRVQAGTPTVQVTHGACAHFEIAV